MLLETSSKNVLSSRRPLSLPPKVMDAMNPLLVVCCCLLACPSLVADDKLVEQCIKNLASAEDKVKVTALQELSRVGSDVKPALPAITKLLKDGSTEVRIQAANTLAVLSTNALDAVPALMEALRKDKEAKVRSYAAFAFKTMARDAKTAVPALIDGLKDKDDEVRCVCADALGRMGPDAKEAVGALAATLKDEDAGPHAAMALVKLGPELAKPSLPALGEALKNSEVRSAAAQALAQLGGLEQLEKALDDKDEDTRIEAILAMKLIGKPAVPALRKALKDKSVEVKLNASNILAKMKGDAEEAVADIAALLKDGDASVRERAAISLGELGTVAKAALPQLNAAKDDKEDRVKTAVRFAILSVMGER
jgi:HEAT repeat protein